MKLSISMYSLNPAVRDKKVDLPGFIRFAKEQGVDAVELLWMYWGSDLEREIDETQELLSELGLKVSAYDAGNNFVNPDIKVRQSQIEHVKECIDVAAKLGAPTVRVFCGDSSNKDPEFIKKSTKWIVESFKECTPYAKDKGIKLGIENHGLFAGKSHQLIEIMEKVDSPNLGLTFDTGNFLLVDEDPSKAIDIVKDKVFHVHFKDFVPVSKDASGGRIYRSLEGKAYKACIGGKGAVDLKKISSVLKGNGYEGWLSIEFEGPEDPFLGTEESVKFAKGLI